MQTSQPRGCTARPRTLIVGGDSRVGRALTDSLRRDQYPLLVTSRRPAGADLHLDLTDCAAWQPPEGIDVAVLCAGVTLPDVCLQDPSLAAQVNVHGTLRIAEELHCRGVFVIYLSSTAVFGAQKRPSRSDEPPCPLTLYGIHKTTVEAALTAQGGKLAIIRLTKILEPDVPLFREWLENLHGGLPIMPYLGLTMAPVPLVSVVTILRLLIDSQQSGTWHISGEEDVTYVEIARRATRLAGVSEARVQPIDPHAAGKLKERTPSCTALDQSGLRETFGIQPPPVLWSIDFALRQIWQQVQRSSVRQPPSAVCCRALADHGHKTVEA